MPITPFGWFNGPNLSTPLSAEELERFGEHIGAYVDTSVESILPPESAIIKDADGDISFGTVRDPSAPSFYYRDNIFKLDVASLVIAEKGDKPDLALRSVGPIDLNESKIAVSTAITGTVTTTYGLTSVTGAGTAFMADLAGVTTITIQGQSFGFTVVNDGSLTLAAPWWSPGAALLPVTVNRPVTFTLTNGSRVATADLDLTTVRNSNGFTPNMGFEVISGGNQVGIMTLFSVDHVGTGTSQITFYETWQGATGPYTLQHEVASYTSNPRAWPETYAGGSLYWQAWGQQAQATVATSSSVSLTATAGLPITSAAQTTGYVKVNDVSSFFGGGVGVDSSSGAAPGFFHITDDSGNTWWILYRTVDTVNNVFQGCTVNGIPPSYTVGGAYGSGPGDGSSHTASTGAYVGTKARTNGWQNPNLNEGPSDQFNGGRLGSQDKAASIEGHMVEPHNEYQRGTELRFLVTGSNSLDQSEVLRLRADQNVEVLSGDLLGDFSGVFARLRGNSQKGVRIGEAGPALNPVTSAAGESGISIGMGFGFTGTVTLLTGSTDLWGAGTAFVNELGTPPVAIWVRGIPYIVSVVTNDTRATLSTKYLGSTVGGQQFFRGPDAHLYTGTRASSPIGTVTTFGTTALLGAGTKFLQLSPGMQITVPAASVTRNIVAIGDDLNLTMSGSVAAGSVQSWTITRHEHRVDVPITFTNPVGTKDAISFSSSNPSVGITWGIGPNLYGESAWRLSSDRQIRAIDGLTTKTNSGSVSDGLFGAAPLDGTLAVDTKATRLSYRSGSVWVTAVKSGRQGVTDLVGPPGFSQQNVTNNGVQVANFPRGWRVIVPRDGTLHDVAVGVAIQSGNLSVAVYDTGDTAGSASSGTRTLLWNSASASCPAVGWNVIGDPNLAVYENQQLEFLLNADNATASFLRTPALVSAVNAQWPTTFNVVPGAALPKWFFQFASVGTLTPWAASVTEANVTVFTQASIMIARVS